MKTVIQTKQPKIDDKLWINPHLQKAIILIITTGISWLDLKFGIAILLIRLLLIFGEWRNQDKVS